MLDASKAFNCVKLLAPLNLTPGVLWILVIFFDFRRSDKCPAAGGVGQSDIFIARLFCAAEFVLRTFADEILIVALSRHEVKVEVKLA